MSPLKAYREREGLTQSQLAARIGVARPSLARWETGARKIDRNLLARVTQETGITARKLRPDLAKLLAGAN